jgi:hypothetical protein
MIELSSIALHVSMNHDLRNKSSECRLINRLVSNESCALTRTDFLWYYFCDGFFSGPSSPTEPGLLIGFARSSVGCNRFQYPG